MILMDKYYVSTASNIEEAINSLKVIEPRTDIPRYKNIQRKWS